MVLNAYKEAKKTLDMMEAELIELNKNDYSAINQDILEAFIDSFITEVGVSDAFLKKFFDSLDVKVIVSNKNAEIQLNLSVLPFVVALKLYIDMAKLRTQRVLTPNHKKSLYYSN